MNSDDWNIGVTEMEQYIDHTSVKMLAYNISIVEKTSVTKLTIKNISVQDYRLFQTILDSFYSPDNPIMGKSIWQGPEGAVFIRSNMPINEALPTTSDYGRRGAVFCGYQMIGTNPFSLVICLHKYRKEDRERKSLYTFEVITVFEEICHYIDSECAMIMLEKMRKYWNTYPQKRIDIYSWSRTVDLLIRKMSYSSEVKNAFGAKYENILCLKRLYSISERNRRWEARTWLGQQDKKYILVKDTFSLLGYPTLEEDSETNLHIALSKDDEIIGMIESNSESDVFAFHSTKSVNVGEIYVMPKHRGSSLSKDLLQFVIEHEKQKDARYLWVGHGTANPNARGFWNKYFKTYQYELVRTIKNIKFTNSV